MGEIQVDLEKSNRRTLPVRTTSRIVQELEAKQVWQVPLALRWTCEDCQNRNVPRNRHCGSREAPNEKKNKPAKEQWKFVVDPTSEPSWSDVALYEKDLHRKNARSIMTPQPNMSTTSEASTTRWKRSQSRRAKKRWRRRTLINVYLESEHPEICLRRGQRDGDANANQKIFLQETMFSQRKYRKTTQRKFRALPSLQPLNILHTHSYCKSNSLPGLAMFAENLLAGYTSAA